MGLSPFSSSSFSDEYAMQQHHIDEQREPLPNPNPNNYTIIRYKSIKHFLVIEIKYHDCTNFEGKKILVFERCFIDDLPYQEAIDPHFSENKDYFSPIARFEPNDLGWKRACKFCNITI